MIVVEVRLEVVYQTKERFGYGEETWVYQTHKTLSGSLLWRQVNYNKVKHALEFMSSFNF